MSRLDQLRHLAYWAKARLTGQDTLPDVHHPHQPPRHLRADATLKGVFEESLDYTDPTGERWFPEEMDGVIQFKSEGEIATERAYAKAIEDPASVVDEPVKANADLDYRGEAGYGLHQRMVTEAHAADPERMQRIAEGLGIDTEEERADGR